uniref:Uncharacterized protein n=1 Tax=Vespula pensylvanica TaxID=30213 RepID=A0A834NQ82_VESPE|nr:hypothetical protein H0235_012085 [Vespula pensylvanica]
MHEFKRSLVKLNSSTNEIFLEERFSRQETKGVVSCKSIREISFFTPGTWPKKFSLGTAASRVNYVARNVGRREEKTGGKDSATYRTNTFVEKDEYKNGDNNFLPTNDGDKKQSRSKRDTRNDPRLFGKRKVIPDADFPNGSCGGSSDRISKLVASYSVATNC